MLRFLGIGAQKAGTSWLYEMLRQHPLIGFPAGKEQHFWDKHYWPGGVAGYFAQFFDPVRHEGEITPAYAHIEPARIAVLRQHAPDLRLIYILRNPIERAWSAALMALERAQMTLDEASDAWFSDVFRSRASVQRGDYEPALRQWHGIFGHDALLILRYERISQDPRGLLRAVARHLDLDPAPFEALDEAELRRRVFAGSGAPLRPSLRPVLEELYRPRIAALEDYLGEPTGW